MHPAAEVWELMSEAELDDLAASIAKEGQRLPIVFTSDGLLLDGRNRWIACDRAGVPQWTTIVQTDDPDALAWDLNNHRRHASEGERALAAARRANLPRGVKKADASNEASQADVAAQFGVSRSAVQRARTVLDHGTPEIVKAVTSGDLAVSLAAKAVRHMQETGEPLTVADIKQTMRRIYREENPLLTEADQPRQPKRAPIALDTFGVINALVRHATAHPPQETVPEIDKWTRLSLLDDIPPAIEYLTELQTRLEESYEDA
jgi:ParB-like chromosome segregation protein Spo0J